MAIIISTIFLLYLVLVILLWLGWEGSGPMDLDQSDFPSVSVLIAVRNEEDNINDLIRSLREQDYPADRLEIIFVNDHSEDGTNSLIAQSINTGKLKMSLINLKEKAGKKAAIEEGIATAEGEIILTTDGDCRMDKSWIGTMISLFNDEKIKMVSGPVNIADGNNFFSRLQSIEFSSLISSGAATIEYSIPIMANAANMAFRKEVYANLEEKKPYYNRSSGDDVFKLHQLAKNNPGSITFCKDRRAIVSTKPATSLTAFYNQRKRWAGKWSSYKSVPTICLAVYIFLVNGLTVALPFLVVFNVISGLVAANLLIAKILFELWFLKSVQKFFENRFLLVEFIILAIIYPFYVTITGILGTVTKYSWKGRRTR